MPRCTPRTRIVGIDEATGYEIWSFFNPRIKRHITMLVRYMPRPFMTPYRFVKQIKQLWIGVVFHFEYTERKDRSRNIIVEGHIETSLDWNQMDSVMRLGDCALARFKEELWKIMENVLDDVVRDKFGDDIADEGTYGYYVSSESVLGEDVVYPTAYLVLRYRRPGERTWRVLVEKEVELERIEPFA